MRALTGSCTGGKFLTMTIRRRKFLQLALLTGINTGLVSSAYADDDTATSPTLKQMITHPLLVNSLYRVSVSKEYAADGAAGSNQDHYQWIEEQRQGAEWIVRGTARQKPEWIAMGWKQLDWGLAQQKSDGGFDSKDPFHSTSFFVEALARSCLIDPVGATANRVNGLRQSANWLMSSNGTKKGISNNLPYTHRRYILAAAFGQSAAVTQNVEFKSTAEQWAENGLALQREDGTNPEKGGYDVGYQMVGVLMALRYLPVCDNPQLRARLRNMMRRAIAPELARQAPDGSFSTEGSTRIGSEHARSGKVKDVPYNEILQAWVYAAQALPQPDLIESATKIAQLRGWLKVR